MSEKGDLSGNFCRSLKDLGITKKIGDILFNHQKGFLLIRPDLTDTNSSIKETHPYIMGMALNAKTFRTFMRGLQLTFWLLWFLLGYNSQIAQTSHSGPLAFAIGHIMILMGAVYINYLWMIPRFLAKRKYLTYLVLFLGLIMLCQGLRYLSEVYILQEKDPFFSRLPMAVGLSFMLLIGSTLFKFIEGWFQVSQRQVQLQNEQLRSELQFLRAQVNPHFLFNTLNNLYSLTLIQDARAPKMVAQLSELMRYLIDDSSTTRVKLLREVELMRSYIALQQLQHEEEKNVDFYVEGIRNRHQIAPLLLISFLENSFKHGDLATNPEGWIAISAIVEEDNQLHISFRNSYRYSHMPTPEVHGIGLKNAQRQLELNYPNRHKLEIEKRPDEFRVDLYITLDLAERSEAEQEVPVSVFHPINPGSDE